MALLRRAVELVDTADAYGPYVSEELIAAALYPYDGLVIATKGGYEPTGQAAGRPTASCSDGRSTGARST